MRRTEYKHKVGAE